VCLLLEEANSSKGEDAKPVPYLAARAGRTAGEGSVVRSIWVGLTCFAFAALSGARPAVATDLDPSAAGEFAASSAAPGLTVRYQVESRALRRLASPSDQLTFRLFRDRACTVTAYSEQLRVSQVHVSRARIMPVGVVTARRSIATLQATLRVTPTVAMTSRYLKVRGPGIRPLGGDCQPLGRNL